MGNIRSRSKEEKKEKREHILMAAEFVFKEFGFEKATITKIAQRANLSRTLVNFYFKDKKQLHNMLEKKALNGIREKILVSIKDSDSEQVKLKKVVRVFMNYISKCNGLYECLLRSEDEFEIFDESLQEDTQKLNNVVVKILQEGIKKKELCNPYDSPTEAVLVIWSILHGFGEIATKKESILKKHWGVCSTKLMANAEKIIMEKFTL